MNETVHILIAVLNDAAVSVFGGVLSASFCDALRTQRERIVFWCGMAVMLIPQGAVYLIWSADFRLRVYPLIVHLPLLLLLYVLTKKLWSPAVSILTAYLFCQLRRWVALLAAVVLPGGAIVQDLTELAVTAPLLLFLLRFAAPAIRQLFGYPMKIQCCFGAIPALYYAFDYLTRVYTDLLSSGEPVVVEFMPFVCCAAYLIFLLFNFTEERKRARLRDIQKNLEIQLAQSVQEINALRQSQEMAARHRHDLRHHLQYLSNCIRNGQEERAQSYISGIFQEIEAQTVQRYCENEAANLILSAFAGRMEKDGIRLEVQGALPAFLTVSDSDLCVLLSNSLENALHACRPLAAAGRACTVSLRLQYHERTGKLTMLVTNPCGEAVRFENGVPVSGEPGHGIGVQSICAIVERYGGACSFQVEDEQFILRLFL
ncbi:sensor histidine kinase [uncultured Oscillibacter sp.]|uniref:sensor histidine kinase n=1 Tax=uncultured Oscillibacter sp. TaxID=876091 RepID=UPI0025CC79DE|nr:ATP-binding protein [uncultured Oscillibacter sp.]